ncbi:DUF3817 domain-containing protein [Mucilaginibacter koreensis]
MQKLFKSPLSRLRIVGYLEGASLLCLVFVAVPLKYAAHQSALVKTLGPIHGGLFLWYVFTALSVGVEQGWKFTQTTWKVLLACIIPFGTFYIDRYVLPNQGSKA